MILRHRVLWHPLRQNHKKDGTKLAGMMHANNHCIVKTVRILKLHVIKKGQGLGWSQFFSNFKLIILHFQ